MLRKAARGGLTVISRSARREQLQVCTQPACEAAHALFSVAVFCQACCPHAGLPALLGSRPLLQLLRPCRSAPTVTYVVQTGADQKMVQRQTGQEGPAGAELQRQDCQPRQEGVQRVWDRGLQMLLLLLPLNLLLAFLPGPLGTPPEEGACCPHAGLPAHLGSRPLLQLLQSCHSSPTVPCVVQGWC